MTALTALLALLISTVDEKYTPGVLQPKELATSAVLAPAGEELVHPH